MHLHVVVLSGPSGRPDRFVRASYDRNTNSLFVNNKVHLFTILKLDLRRDSREQQWTLFIRRFQNLNVNVLLRAKNNSA